MKIKFLALFLFVCTVQIFGQTDGYIFTDIKRLKVTPVEDQYRSGTCWSFSGLSFVEAEMIRLNKKQIPNLSEMFVVRQCYSDKALKTVRLHGHTNFSGGGSFADIFYVLKKYGMLPEDVYTGLQYGEKAHVHGELDGVLKAYIDDVIKNNNKKISTAWHKGFNGILDAYLGTIPEKFNYQGKEYTARTFADDVIGINPDDYVNITSYSHHPFYSTFILEVPDNWLWGEFLNVPIEDLKLIFENAIANDYPIAWAADVSDKGFAYNKGFAVIPDVNIIDMSDSEKSKWEKLSDSEKNAQIYKLEKPGKEKNITQLMRQEAFDNYDLTDDHGMLVMGTAKDQIGNKYYIIKNSWGTENIHKGYFYASEAFILYKTMSITINKNAIPTAIRKKCGI